MTIKSTKLLNDDYVLKKNDKEEGHTFSAFLISNKHGQTLIRAAKSC